MAFNVNLRIHASESVCLFTNQVEIGLNHLQWNSKSDQTRHAYQVQPQQQSKNLNCCAPVVEFWLHITN